MMHFPQKRPVVLVLAGHDPSGGAGIQADIESIGTAGCHALTVITALTAQNTGIFSGFAPQDSPFFEKQLDLLLNDFQIDACKIGMVGNEIQIGVIAKVLSGLNIPTVLDPVLITGTNETIADKQIQHAMLEKLLPLCSIITPNSIEARSLADTEELTQAAGKLMDYGCSAVLITGTHEKTDQVINRLYQQDKSVTSYTWERLAGVYHGSGCTLSSRIAAQLALGDDIKTAVEIAQNYTWNSLQQGLQLGKTQLLPDRFFNCHND